MASFTIAEMLAIEAAALADGWTEEQLLHEAGTGLASSISHFFPRAGTLVGYLGKGHNAGDALVALRILRDRHGWDIILRNAFPFEQCAPLTRATWETLGVAPRADPLGDLHDLRHPVVLLDALLGSGTSGSLRAPLVGLAGEMAALRARCGARVAAVDIPSGMDPDTGDTSPNCVIADVTFMIGAAKRGLLTGHATAATGALALVSVEGLAGCGGGDLELIAPQTHSFGKSPRPFEFHKGMAGRVALIAGSECYAGAAVIAASGALRGGAGLVTLFTPHAVKSLVAGKCPPEVIVRGFKHPGELLEFRFDSLVVGCGMAAPDDGFASGLVDLIRDLSTPVVIDAGALDVFSADEKLSTLAARHILTPHPGEFARLAPDLKDLPREVAAHRFSDRCAATLVLKGSRTIVTQGGQALWCNSTGTPAMATGGHGDLLAGVIGARLATGAPPLEAAALSAWICGRSAEIAMNERHLSEESLVPSDVLHYLGAAFKDWRTNCR